MTASRRIKSFMTLASIAALALPAAAQDLGREGPSYQGAGATPSGSKPQSKLWFHDGAWWASLFNSTARVFRIHRLDPATQAWIDTGVTIDTRHTSRADCLADGNKLYIGSHHFQELGFDGFPLLVFRYTYDPIAKSYSLDTGFPVQVANTSTEAIGITKDSQGVVWAAWTAGLRVWVSHTVGNDLTWAPPIVLPANTTDIRQGDLSSIVRFQGNKVGVLWSDQVVDAYRFSFHNDGAPDGVWSAPEDVLAGPGQADDHIHVKASSDGRLFAIVKNSFDETLLRVRSPAGVWGGTLVSSAADGWTRSILMLNEERRLVYAIGMEPVGGGTIYAKISSMDAPSFMSGRGAAIMKDAEDPNLQDVTSTKQLVNSTTGVVFLASHQTTRRYWQRRFDLRATTTQAPEASFMASPTSGAVPLRVRFDDTSAGTPTAWLWTFGDGASSTLPDPEHVYRALGKFTVRLRVTNSAGTDEVTQVDVITVGIGALADSYVRDHHVQHDHGSESEVKARRKHSHSDYEAYIKFDLSSHQPIDHARLRVFVTEAGGRNPRIAVYDVSNNWSEHDLEWNDRPDIPARPIVTSGTITQTGWREFDLGSALAGRGTVSLAIVAAGDNDKVGFSSRESSRPPLILPVD